MSNIKVTTSTLLNEAKRIEDLNRQFHSAVSRLTCDEASLNGMWKGEANDAFHRAFMTDKEKMNTLYCLMNQYVCALRAIAQRYNTAEQTNVCTAKTRTY